MASDDSLSQEMYTDLAADLISLSSEQDPEVKRNALEGLATIVKTNWLIIKNHLPALIKFASDELPIRKDLIEEIQLPDNTVQKLDKGLPIRRAAYNLLLALFEVGALNSDDVLSLINALISIGLVDTSNDIVILVLHVLAQLTKKTCVAVVSKLDAFLPILEKKLAFWIKQPSDQALQLVMAILRVVFWLDDSAEMHDNPNQVFQDFVKN